MALDPGSSGRRSVSPESSGQESPIPRQWRNQLGGAEPHIKDKAYKRYASGVEKALAVFETGLEEWADYISFLNRLLKALQSRPSSVTTIPAKSTVAKRLSQCLNPSLPSGVHQKSLEVYSCIFSVIKRDGLSRDLPLYLPGLAPTLSFASLSVRSPFLDLLEVHFLKLDPRSLRPAMKSMILALLPGLEEETSDDFDRTLQLLTKLKEAIRLPDADLLTECHSSGDSYFWQCFFLASITCPNRRPGALAYLVRYLPSLGFKSRVASPSSSTGTEDALMAQISTIVTSPEPGLLVRCFSAGLSDEQLLIQRGFLDLLVTHLPLHSSILQSGVKAGDLELLLISAVGVISRRDMSLNRRLWSWLLGPDTSARDGDQTAETPSSSSTTQAQLTLRTSYFETYGLQPLTRALLGMIKRSIQSSAGELAKPFRICLSLMDRWEIGGLVVPEVFLPIVNSVQKFRERTSNHSEFSELLRSASVFFDGIESGLIFGELVGLLAQAIGPGNLSGEERSKKVSLIKFVITNFNVREEEMVTTHAPLSCLAALCMVADANYRQDAGASSNGGLNDALVEEVLSVVTSLLEMIPESAFPKSSNSEATSELKSHSDMHILKKVRSFYVDEQGSLDTSPPPFTPFECGHLLLVKARDLVCDFERTRTPGRELSTCIRVFLQVLLKVPNNYSLDVSGLLHFLNHKLAASEVGPFSDFASVLKLSTHLRTTQRTTSEQLSSLVAPLVRHAWGYLSSPEPKHHVEATRYLWQLQSALTSRNRDIEAALASIMVAQNRANESLHSAHLVHSFGVLWTHTLQDNPSDRTASRSFIPEYDGGQRLAGMDHFDLMLTQPLFLTLDALLDETSPLFMAVKSWLRTVIGIDRLFLIFASNLRHITLFQDIEQNGLDGRSSIEAYTVSESDDLELCVYYVRTLHLVLRCCGDTCLPILASRHFTFDGDQGKISSGVEESLITFKDFFVRVCVRCITAQKSEALSQDLNGLVTDLYRFALGILHRFCSFQQTSFISGLEVEDILFERLLLAINSNDSSQVQVLLLDTLSDILILRKDTSMDIPPPPHSPSERRGSSMDHSRQTKSSISVTDVRPITTAPPPQLFKCLQAGISSDKSRLALDTWIGFLGRCLPLFGSSVFQVVIPLVETLCKQLEVAFSRLADTFDKTLCALPTPVEASESTLIYLLNGLEQVLARAHDQLLAEEGRSQLTKSPDQPQSIFGSMVSGVFQSDFAYSRNATANDRLTVHLAFQDAVRMCFKIWRWGQGKEDGKQDPTSSSSFSYTSLRMRNRARRLLEHLFTAESLECLETIIGIWRSACDGSERLLVFNFLASQDASRPRQVMPALFTAIYSRTNPSSLEPGQKSTMTISLSSSDLVMFLVDYARSLDDDATGEIWQDCMVFLKDLLGNPFPHRQTLPSLLEFAAILGVKVDNTNFGEQRRLRKELADLFLRLLAAMFTTRPLTFTDRANADNGTEKPNRNDALRENDSRLGPSDNPDDVVFILANITPSLLKILLEPERVVSAAGTISTNAVGPALRSKFFPESVSRHTMVLLQELAKLPNNHKTWRKDVGEAFHDSRFFSMSVSLVKENWLPLLRQWALTDKEKIPDLISRISAPSTAGIVFGVGATSARLEADRKTQLNLRRIATLVLASVEDAYVADLPAIVDKLEELLAATPTSSPSSTTRADAYLVVRALVLRTSSIQLAPLWPIINAEMHAAISSVVAADQSAASETYTNASILQACKLLDLLVCVAPDDFQLHEWLFVTDTIEAVYRSSSSQPIALVDELSEELGSVGSRATPAPDTLPHLATGASLRRPLLGAWAIEDVASLECKDELVARVLRPFFAQLSIYAFESTYAMGTVDRDACVEELLKDLFDDRTVVRTL